MRSRWFVLFSLLTSLAFAQAKKPAQSAPHSAPAAAHATPAPSSTAPGTPGALSDSTVVLTLEGVCSSSATKSTATAAACRTQLTKGEFERMLNAITPPGMPPIPPAMKRERANQLAQLLTVAAAAEKSGTQNTPEGQEMLRIAKLQALANIFVRDAQLKAKPTDAEIETYYKNNEEKYQQASVQQILVPMAKSGTTTAPSTEATVKERAEKLRERAIAGEPFDKLEKEAIEGTSYQTAPPVDLTLQRETLPPSRQFVFGLKDGEFSQVVTEPTGAIFYKMISKTTVPLAKVKENISQRLMAEKFRSTMESLLKSATPVLNDAYFGSTAPKPAPATAAPAKPGVEVKSDQAAPTPNQPK